MTFAKNKRYLQPSDYPSFLGKTITFCVTNNCNLRCSYCYIHTKDEAHEMSVEMATDIIDAMFDNPTAYFDDTLDAKNRLIDKQSTGRRLADKLTFEFIGGEPLLRMDLLTRASEHILKRNAKEKFKYVLLLTIGTNGLLYLEPACQDFLNMNDGLINIGITIDGTKEMHDSCRLFPNGDGSYDFVRRSIDSWIKKNPAKPTKITISPANINLLSDSLIHLWSEVGIQYLPANCLFEDVWEPHHEELFSRELERIKKFLLTDRNYLYYCTSLFDPALGRRLAHNDLTPPCGGNGRMLHWMHDGTFFNCIRFSPTACHDGKGLELGNLKTGWNKQTLHLLNSMNRRTSSDDECFYCDVASGCGYCPGMQYDYFGDPNRRSKAICGMHKTRARISGDYYRELDLIARTRDCSPFMRDIDISAPVAATIADEQNRNNQRRVVLSSFGSDPSIDYEEILDDYYKTISLLRKEVTRHMANLPAGDQQSYFIDFVRQQILRKDLFEIVPISETRREWDVWL